MQKGEVRTNWKLVFYLAFIFLGVLIIQDFVKEVVIFNRNVEVFRDDLNDRLKEEVRNEVLYRVDEIENNIDNINEEIEEHVIEDIDPLIFSLSQSFSLMDGESLESKEEVLINTVRAYNNLDLKHCYFVMNVSGYLQYDCESDELVNEYVLGYKDSLNRQFYQMLLDGVFEDEEALVSYYIDDSESISKMLTYGIRDVETGLIYGITVRFENYTDYAKDDLIYSFTNYYENTDRSIFILGGDSEILFNSDSSIIGSKIGEIGTHPFFIAGTAVESYLDENDEGYLEYTVVIDNESIDKVAYTKYIEEWDIIIGSDIEKGAYDYLVEEYRNNNYNITIIIKIPIYLILLLIGYGIYRVVDKNIFLSVMIYEEDEKLYKKFADITSESIVISSKSGEFRFINRFGENTMFNNISNYEDYNINQILVEEDGFFSIYTEQDTYHVKYNIEEIKYHNEDCDLYIITDVTDKITTEKRLRELSLEDELTKLGNRRLMVKEFKDDIVPFVKEGNTAYLVMIDLDNFKNANDSYGHRFGDQVLAKISNIFTSNLSKDTKIYRIGGDEFAILTKAIEMKDLVSTLYRIIELISEYDFGKDVNISFSAGIAEIKASDKKRRLSDYYEIADEKLYQAKEEGKRTIKF